MNPNPTTAQDAARTPVARRPRAIDDAFGRELRRRRRIAGVSLRELAALVSYSTSHLSRIESATRAPSTSLARRCDTVLEAAGRLAALATRAVNHAQPGRDSVMDPDSDPVPEPDRAELLAATAVALSAAVHDVPIRSSLAPGPTLLAFDRILAACRALGQSHPPSALTTLMSTQVAMLHDLARTSSDTDRHAYCRLLARFCDYLGWMWQEADRDEVSLDWIRRARSFAVAADDEAMIAYSRVRQSEIALYRADALSTVQLARRAQAATTDAKVRGLAALTEAQGHALHGDARRCHRALDQAADWFGVSIEVDEPEPGLGSSTMPDPVAFVTAWCLNDLGRPADSQRILEAELLRLPEQAHRTRARYGARLALALAGTGDITRMCDVLGAVLDIAAEIDSATVRADLRLVSLEAKRWRTLPAVENTIDRLALALRSRDHRFHT